ncbi:MAG TPA: vanadium-dependent haloperoxidase [Pseudonocardiaceae bacterium]
MLRKKTVLGAAAAVVVAAGIAVPLLASAGCAASSGGEVAASVAEVADSPGSGHAVADWNRTLISTLAVPNAQPASVHPTRSFAMVQAAEYNAVVSITHAGRPYRSAVPAAPGARPDAAADQAAHDVMVGLYPSMRATFDGQLATQLAGLPAGSATRDGVAVGSAAARAILAERQQDGSARPAATFVAGTVSGAYRPTPPKFGPPMFTSWGSVRPFLLNNADQLRPAAPPSVTTAGYTAALAEVKRIGQDSSTTRSADQTVAAKFWSASPIWNTWNQIADQLIDDQHATLAQASSVLARMDLAMADTTIALYDAKYHQPVWRPVTAIELGVPAAHPSVPADPTWKPLTPTAADPSYPGAHSALSTTAAEVLTAFYGSAQPVTVTTTATGTVSRHFPTLAAAAQEAGLSRIWAGQHTRLDHEAGQQLGRQVTAQVLTILPATLNTR